MLLRPPPSPLKCQTIVQEVCVIMVVVTVLPTLFLLWFLMKHLDYVSKYFYYWINEMFKI